MTPGVPTYNVSELTFLIKSRLEEGFPVVRVRGEISGFRPAASGHCYFTLKDRDAVISAVLFRTQRQRLDFTPEDGMSVSALGRVTVYAQRGNYQLVCESMEQTGRGDILYRLEMLKKKLAAEGLFDPEIKRPLPPYPRRIAAVTSARGAAIQDIIRVLKRRMPRFELKVYDALVQGDQAPETLIRALAAVYREGTADVIILGRGGGSVEDLLPFSDETVVRMVAASPIPLVCAVGHEIDFSLSDFAADLRAATPSAAAEIVSAGTVQASQRIRSAAGSLRELMIHAAEKQRWRLEASGPDVLKVLLRDGLDRRRQTVDLALQEMDRSLKGDLEQKKGRVALLKEVLDSASPEAALARGFALIRREGVVVPRAAGLAPGEQVELEFADGRREARITGEDA